ncbi:MAG: multicopper oxidase family protein [Gemmatimonadota bacterium]|nr:multicopper oxidase family protein [Gemmatimonadota bacterium]
MLRRMDRRHFLSLGSAAGLAVVAHRGPALEAAMAAYHAKRPRRHPHLDRALLRPPPEVSAANLTLRAAARRVEIAPGVPVEVWSPGDGPVGPTIRARTGDTATITLENALAEPTILHWHGLRVPEAADGHPRLAIAPGSTYRYTFPVIDRAGTYWYHAHPHHRTGVQAYRGMTGVLLVNDAAEEALGLPDGAHEVPLLIQDRRLAADGTFAYEPAMHEQMEGFFGDAAFANGIRLPTMPVETTTYRLRVVNATTSRLLRLALSNGHSMTLIGNDGGLLPAAETVTSLDLGTGERADLLVDFAHLPVGSRVTLVSAPFASPARMGGMGMGMGGMGRGMGRGAGGMGAGGVPQGGAMDLVEFTIDRAVTPRGWTPRPLPTLVLPDPQRATRTRTFRFNSAMMQHDINGRAFDMERIDETVRFGDTEVWTFVNDGPFPHPVHVHEVQFQVIERVGGRARVMPWERGLKDTVLVHPGERVSVAATFDRYRGRFLLHCHNMVHEDMGMMMNYAIV